MRSLPVFPQRVPGKESCICKANNSCVVKVEEVPTPSSLTNGSFIEGSNPVQFRFGCASTAVASFLMVCLLGVSIVGGFKIWAASHSRYADACIFT